MGQISLSGWPVSAVVLDLDGTLIHTTVDFSRMKLQLISDMINMGVPEDVLDSSISVTRNLGLAHSFLITSGRSEEWVAIEHRASDMMERAELEHVHLTRPVRGARETVLRLRRMGLQVGLLTRGSRRYATAAMGYAGLDGMIDVQKFRDDDGERNAKPNPLALHRIADNLGTPVGECLMVGDHLIDSACAHDAGALFIGVLTGSFSREDWCRAGCRYVDSVADVPGALRISDNRELRDP